MKFLWLSLVLLLGCGPALGVDAERGEGLYQNHCTGCHDSRAHVREGRKATDREDLHGWVQRWATNLALDWGESEVDDVAAYLEARFYKFKRTATQ